MTSISRLINKRIANLINRFNVPKVSPHMVEEIKNNSRIDNELASIGLLKDS